jgi:hypothetical protein
MATMNEQSAKARLTALHKEAGVIIRQRTNEGPLEPAFQATCPVDILDFMGRAATADNAEEDED